MIELIKELTGAIAPSGYEDDVRDIIKDKLSGICEMYTDAIGNLVAHKKGNGKKIMFAAHMDEIGIMVTYIEKDGFLRFAEIGGVAAHPAIYARVKFTNGVVGVIGYGDKKEIKDAKIQDMFIDIGAKSYEEAEKLISIGASGIFLGDFMTMGDFITSKSIDDRIGCALLIETAKQVSNSPNDLYFVFTVQEEIGVRGGKVAAYDICPDVAIAIDTTASGDTPDGYKMAVDLGKGPAIKVKDSNIIAHPKVKTALIECANEFGIDYQMEVLENGGTDAGAIQLTRGGIPSGTLSIPCRYIHSTVETINMSDVKGALKLLCAVCNKKL